MLSAAVMIGALRVKVSLMIAKALSGPVIIQDLFYLAHQIRIWVCFTWTDNSYLTMPSHPGPRKNSVFNVMVV